MTPTKKARFKRRFLGLRPWKRHSLVLMVAGLSYICVGVSYIVTDTTPARAQALALALRWFPIEFWGAVWMIVGSLAVISSRWPPVFESWGYSVLTGLAAGWSGTYGLGIIFFHASWTNLSQVVVWALLAFLWWAISGLLNPDRTVVGVHGLHSSDS